LLTGSLSLVMDENNGIMESILPLPEKGPGDPSAFFNNGLHFS